MPMTTDEGSTVTKDSESRARREAAAIVAEHGQPRSLDTLTSMLALAYTKGAADATTETADALRAHLGGEAA